MADAALILALCLLFVYGLRLMARLDRFLSFSKNESTCQPRFERKTNILRAVFVLYLSGKSMQSIAQMLSHRLLPFWKNRKEYGILGEEVFKPR